MCESDADTERRTASSTTDSVASGDSGCAGDASGVDAEPGCAGDASGLDGDDLASALDSHATGVAGTVGDLAEAVRAGTVDDETLAAARTEVAELDDLLADLA
jgi:hypothetical protein